MTATHKKKRIIIFISGAGTNMATLIDKTISGELNAEIVGVFSNNRHAEGLAIASKKNISVHVFPYDESNRHATERQMMSKIRSLKTEYIVLAGFMRLLSPEFVSHFKNKIINIHPSFLPAFKGANAISDALKHKATGTGVTIHWVSDEMDAGKIIAQQSIAISDTDNLQSLSKKIHAVEHNLYWRTLNDIFKTAHQ